MPEHIYLYGPPGSGKSAAGLALASALGLSFVDLDQAIEQAAGQSIPEIMAESGEAGFRDWETRILNQIAAAETAHLPPPSPGLRPRLGGPSPEGGGEEAYTPPTGWMGVSAEGVSPLPSEVSSGGSSSPLPAERSGAGISPLTPGEGGAKRRVREGVPGSSSPAAGGSVVALGGGALLREENRRLAESTGRVVCLWAEAATLERRLAADPAQRPLLAGSLRPRLVALLAERTGHYASFSIRISTESLTPGQVAAQIQVALGRYHLQAMGRGYDVVVQSGGLDTLGERLRQAVHQAPEAVTAVVVSDEHVAPLYAGRVLESLRRVGFRTGSQAHLQILPPGESSKTLEGACRLWQGFLAAGLDRQGLVVALGGGVVGDLAGFAAATFLRGVAWAAVPTSLLAIVDASLGGKTGIDLPEGKNLVGAFHPPRLVLADPETLATLPPREFTSGLAEVLKAGVIADPELYRICAAGPDSIRAHLPEVLSRAVAVKVRLVEDDPYERGMRAALNLGHTVGHAVEAASDYRLLHGEAVAIGMAVEARLAERLGMARDGLGAELAGTLASLGLPARIPPDLSGGEIIRRMRVDKKLAAGTVRFALPIDIGRVQVGVEVTDLEQILEE